MRFTPRRRRTWRLHQGMVQRNIKQRTRRRIITTLATVTTLDITDTTVVSMRVICRHVRLQHQPLTVRTTTTQDSRPLQHGHRMQTRSEYCDRRHSQCFCQRDRLAGIPVTRKEESNYHGFTGRTCTSPDWGGKQIPTRTNLIAAAQIRTTMRTQLPHRTHRLARSMRRWSIHRQSVALYQSPTLSPTRSYHLFLHHDRAIGAYRTWHLLA